RCAKNALTNNIGATRQNTFGNCWRDISPRPKSPSRRRPSPMRPRSLLLPTPSRTVRTRKWVQQTQQADATADGAASSPDAASPRNIIGTGVRAALVRALARAGALALEASAGLHMLGASVSAAAVGYPRSLLPISFMS